MNGFTTRDGVELSYTDSGGDGIPLVMLHGWGQTQAMFRHQVEGLARRVVTLDQRGHGVSAKPHHGYRIARLARDAHELLDHLAIDRADVLGWSMGVSVWWSFIDQFGTDRIRRFVAVDQPAAVAAVPWMSAQEQTDSGAIFDVAVLLGLGGALAGPESAKAAEELRAQHVLRRAGPGGLGVRRAGDHAHPAVRGRAAAVGPLRAGLARRAPRIDVPTLVIGCDGSHVAPSSQRFIADQIPGAELHVFPSDVANSHFPFLENPAAFNAVVAEFLER